MSSAPMIGAAYGFGKANFSDFLTTIVSYKVVPAFDRRSSVTTGKSMASGPYGASGNYSAGAVEERGTLYRRTVEHEAGSVILIQVSWKRGRGDPMRDGAVFIQLRAGAPCYRIMANLPPSAENTYGPDFNVFEGNGDIIGAEELAAQGFEIPKSYTDKFLSPIEIDECFCITKLAGETARRPVIATVTSSNGSVRTVELSVKPRRRMTIR